MGTRSGGEPRKRFSRSGHTTHQPRVPPPYEPPPYQPPPYQPPPGGPPPPESGFGTPTYHHTPAASRPPQPGQDSGLRGVGKATLSGTNRAARYVTQKVITASKADGADESGLTALIWNQVLSYGTDAMVTVALAGTVFFGASAHAQRGNVLLYLLITMAPFALIAPVIGPALDRLQHGRRWTMAGTAIGRAALALIMAGHPTELLVLYPCALGSLVLSKAYGVVRAAAAPRLVPPGMTLTQANSRLTIFGLGSTLVLGGFVGVVIKATGSYTVGLIVTAMGFVACAIFAVRLPPQVDSATSAARRRHEPPRPKGQAKAPVLRRLVQWAGKGFEPHVVVALQGESALRLLSGMLTIYLAFYVESTSHGWAAAVALGGVIGAAGAGNFTGTAIGTRLKPTKPEVVIIVSTCSAALICLITAFTFTMLVAVIAMFVASVCNALGKIALDSLIQKDVTEMLRSSAFGRSETFLQLAWVVGAAIGVGLPSNGPDDGMIAFIVATVVLAAASIVVVLRNRAMNRLTAHRDGPSGHPHAGSVVPHSMD
ncbi:MAG TPA: MFS transporter [Jatrophihabitans sp.]|nr:MFS transporter [Jatrophihabitans sp.]